MVTVARQHGDGGQPTSLALLADGGFPQSHRRPSGACVSLVSCANNTACTDLCGRCPVASAATHQVDVEGHGTDDCSARWSQALPAAVLAYQQRVQVDPDAPPDTRPPSSLGTTLVTIFSVIFALILVVAFVAVVRLVVGRRRASQSAYSRTAGDDETELQTRPLTGVNSPPTPSRRRHSGSSWVDT